jgi:outer membrane protein assembly factor BamA
LTSGSGNSSSNSSYSKNNFEIQNLSTEINNQENRNDISNKFSNSNNGNVSNAPLFGHLRASAGAGLAIALAPSVNLEVTYSIPILKASHDIIKPFQLGVGLSIG